ncbi:unnamed protein product [Zymoseptoria tritici ST99CH_3D1]|uniref:Concanavalin A-like lectin/glucanase n=1 Tax=Zymoseptoria tritici (strain CBS 115943 / IPO323) TaxID=336722 RepID=F9XR40_ZYMTI|nr:uncharacterized protein MYCGRDRAFT_97702 [Zymoseptoria tritici IPO323]EGP82280.1 hypothetical protein MYCGRDRAFT_97702 [Zymoseptoria tritici IPO323]SMR64827.1 unnamed protein product [Zymoseptoria tritici ST99CH_3D1]
MEVGTWNVRTSSENCLPWARDIQYVSYPDWAGAIQYGEEITEVSASFIVPEASKPKHAEEGIAWEVQDNDKTVYSAWSEWWPTGSIDYDDFTLKPGDVIFVRVVANGKTGGTTYIQNEATGQTASKTFTNEPSLCLTSAEWIVEDDSGFGPKPFAKFTPVEFIAAEYTQHKKSVSGIKGATMVDMVQDGYDVADCSIDGDDGLTCRYTGYGEH